MRVRAAAYAAGGLFMAIVPPILFQRAFPVTSGVDQVASMLLSLLWGLAVGRVWAMWLLRRLRRH